MCALICFILSGIKQLIIFFNLFVDTSKKKRELTLLHYEVLAYPKKRNRQAHAMTKHSIDIALKIPFLLKSASFRSEIFGERICYI